MKKLIIMLLLTLNLNSNAQNQTRTPSIFANNTSIGNAAWGAMSWTSVSDNFTSTTQDMFAGDISNYIVLTGFGFAIPAGSVITGITVSVDCGNNDGPGVIRDHIIKVVKGGVIAGNNMAASNIWPRIETTINYGGIMNMWGLPWNVSNINASNFGVAISVREFGPFSSNGSIDQVRITVNYTTPLPIDLVYFNGASKDSYNQLEWKSETETNNDFFTIEKSVNAFEWNEIINIKGSGNSTTSNTYQFLDYEITSGIIYYRLKQTDYNGKLEYFNIVSINSNTKEIFITRITNLLGQDIYSSYEGIRIITYSDGSIKKIKTQAN